MLTAARRALVTILRRPSTLAWYLWRLRHREYGLPPPPLEGHAEIDPDAWTRHEPSLRAIATRKSALSFLEIGLGAHPRIERHRVMRHAGVRYTGCDFEAVCVRHEAILAQHDLAGPNVRLLGNRVGTYSWNLMELLRQGERFDTVYLDGHHTFYVDLPALMLGHLLLKPGGYFVLDDVRWTLRFMQHQLYTRENEWRFYHRVYDFSQYDEAQMAVPHIGLIAKTVLIDQFGYNRHDELSTPFWWALEKVPQEPPA